MKPKSQRKKNKVNTLREGNVWSMSELARRAGVTPQTISKMERGEPTSRISQLKVARAFGKNIDYVFD